MNFIEIIIGVLVANAIPHLIFGLTKTHFLGLFGYSPKGNIIYALIQFVIAIVLFVFNNGCEALFNNGYLIGGISVLLLYFIFGKVLVKFYGNKKSKENK